MQKDHQKLQGKKYLINKEINMKKILSFLIASAIALSFSSCGEEDCDHFTDGGSDISYSEIAGTWYEPEFNEEVRFTESGWFYDKYANHMRCAYTEGRYEISGNHLTYRYNWGGQSHQVDNTISNVVNGISIKISSKTTGSLTCYRVTDTISMEPDGEVTLPTDGLESPDERLLTIDGLTAKANGMKGTLYLKNSDGTYVKVVIGNETDDLWYDYTSFIGSTVAEVKKKFGTPSESREGMLFYSDMNGTHDIIEYVTFVYADDVVTRVELNLKEGVVRPDIDAYLAAKYFKNEEGDLYFSHKTYEHSSFYAVFSDNGKAVVFCKRPPYIFDFTLMFKRSANDINSTQLFQNEEIISSSSDSIRYTLNQMADLNFVTFYFRGKGNLMNSYAVEYSSKYTEKEIHEVLSDTYKYMQKQTFNGQEAEVYTSNDFTITVLHYPALNRIEYYDLTQEEETKYLWLSYTNLLNDTRDKVISVLGEPFYEQDPFVVYRADVDYFDHLFFRLNSGKVDAYYFTIKEGIDINKIKEYLNSKYHFLREDKDKKQTMWINTEDRSSATVGIQLYEEEGQLWYFYIGA